jgi:hypothetical protein
VTWNFCAAGLTNCVFNSGCQNRKIIIRNWATLTSTAHTLDDFLTTEWFSYAIAFHHRQGDGFNGCEPA